MKHSFTRLLVFALLALSTSAGRGQWVQTNGPYHAPVYSLLSIGDKLVTATEGGPYRSSNSGQTWISSLSDAAFDPWLVKSRNTIYLTPYYGSSNPTWFSTDTGQSWRKLPDSQTVIQAAIDTVLFAFDNSNSTVIRSIDAGHHWYLANKGLPTGRGISDTVDRPWPVEQLVSNGMELFAILHSDPYGYFLHGLSLYRSNDFGQSWKPVNVLLPQISYYSNGGCASGSSVVVAIDSESYFSNDDGLTWDSLRLVALSVLQVSNRVLLGTDRGLLVSTDGGKRWTESDSGLPNKTFRGLVQNNNGIFAGTGAGVVRSTDSGATWVLEDHGLYGSVVNQLDVFGNSIVSREDGAISSSSDMGDSWELREGNLGSLQCLVFVGDALLLFSYENGVLVSWDSGGHWLRRNFDSNSNNYYWYAAVSSRGIVIASTYSYSQSRPALIRSPDTGKTWEMLSVALNWGYVWSLVGYDSLVFALADSGIFRSLDLGTHWEKVATNSISGRLFRSSGILFKYTYDLGLWKSTDDGATWLPANNGLPKSRIYALASRDSLLFACSDFGVFASTNQGLFWQSANTGLLRLSVSALAILNSDIYCGGSVQGVWRRNIREMVSSLSVPIKKSSRAMLVCYPNPLTTSTTITLSSPAAGFAQVTVVNLLGQEVARVFAGAVDAGEHSFVWQKPSGLPAGMYECIVRINGSAERVAMIVE
ncbi:MAG: T9SS type A sorting domain-containing protein [Bacteroidota bacterium]|nr:T9SS type A sorting domain-containing protein [Bacteroidota bacterium]MDP4233768.1 T9SS type A sorting domain-containing protein [Bacteroidota bacterium]MDP4242407.1 T9SS type A sorting domain-containing protein [Bacteroidota bacterium]MDP4287529.1 T9SS type A sorting domain-containing protein [Bacteroidota bacterium]